MQNTGNVGSTAFAAERCLIRCVCIEMMRFAGLGPAQSCFQSSQLRKTSRTRVMREVNSLSVAEQAPQISRIPSASCTKLCTVFLTARTLSAGRHGLGRKFTVESLMAESWVPSPVTHSFHAGPRWSHDSVWAPKYDLNISDSPPTNIKNK